MPCVTSACPSLMSAAVAEVLVAAQALMDSNDVTPQACVKGVSTSCLGVISEIWGVNRSPEGQWGGRSCPSVLCADGQF